MSAILYDRQLSRLSDFVGAKLGLRFPRERWDELERLTKTATQEFGFDDADKFMAWLVESPLTQAQIDMLATHLTIAETYFWREPQVFAALKTSILPELIQARAATGRRLRFWSAGCATGEEVYSLAILLTELIPDLPNWHITMLATDVNPHLLRQAAAGSYGEWSFRAAPPRFKERYFQRAGDGQFQLAAHIRKMVTFAYLNLAEAGYPSRMNNTHDMDIIFCRNVLMYFVPERAQFARQRLFQALVEGGWLLVAASELSQQKYAAFASVRFPGAFAYRRVAQPAPPLPRPVAAPPLAPAAPALDLALAVRALANQGQLVEALVACEAALAASKPDPVLHYLHASILQEHEQAGEARVALNRALYLDPGFVLAHFALGMLAQREGQLASARKSFGNALALLDNFEAGDALPEGEGLTAGRLTEILRASLKTGVLAL